MASDDTVLGRSVVGPDFNRAVSWFVRETAALAQSTAESNAQAGIKLRPTDPAANLSRFASYVDGLNIRSQPLRALQLLSDERPEVYAPPVKSQQRRLLSLLASHPEEVDPADILDELVAAAADDASERLGEQQSRMNQAEEQARLTGAALESTTAALEEIREEADSKADELAAASAELEQARAERDFALSIAPEEGERESGAKVPGPPELEKVATGVYQRPNGKLKVMWPNPDKPGASLSETIDGTVEEAVALREARIEQSQVPA